MASEWLPIESAPKDGSPVQLKGGAPDWCKHSPADNKHLEHAPMTAVWEADLWVIAFCEDGFVAVAYENPTHWRSLT